MEEKSVGVWGATPAIRKSLRSRSAVKRYGGKIKFLSDEDLDLSDYTVRLIFIDEKTPLGLVSRVTKLLRLEPDRTFIASTVPDVFPTYHDQTAAINALLSWLDRDSYKAQQPEHQESNRIEAAFMAGFPRWPKSNEAKGEDSTDESS